MRDILLVNPSNRTDPLENVRTLVLPPLNLALLAGCTPDLYSVRIIDEVVEPIDFETDAVLVGITCMTPLATMNKRVNLGPVRSGFSESIRRIHAHGISVVGAFMFGCDDDPPDVFSRTVDFIRENGIDGAQFTIQTPLPGTRLYEELAEKGRLRHCEYPDDWRKYNVFDVVFEPSGISPEELKRGQIRAYRSLASLGPALFRAAGSLWRTRNPLGTAVAYSWTRGCYTALSKATRV